jgi:protease-4
MRKYHHLFLVIMLISLFSAGCIFLKMDLKSKEDLEEQFVTGKEDSQDKILIIPINGVIFGDDESMSRNGTNPAKINEILNKADKDPQIKAIILEVDSPGGGVTASDRIYNSLKDFKKTKNNIPIVTLMKDTAASGGYYVSMSSDYIVAHPTSITGSIGVISVFVTAEDLLKWAQIEVVVVKSGAMKDAGSPFRRMKPQEREQFQNLVDEIYQGFLDIVAQGRKSLTVDQIKALADGRVFTGKQAMANKLVDAVGYQEDAINKAKELAKIQEAKVVRYKKPKGAFESAFQIKMPETDLAQLREILLQNTTSRFMYLWIPGAE